jgi:uncharacterized protein (TIGR03083 family)
MATPARPTGNHSHAHELRADDYPGLVHEQRHRISTLAHSLTPEQWTAPSLCEGWRVCDVLGHITYGYTTPLPKVLALIVFRYRGDVNRGSDVVSRALADELTQDELVERLDAGFDRPVGLGKSLKPPEALCDHLVHELDIRRPLGLPVELEPALLVGTLSALMTVKTKFFAPAKVAEGLRFQALDVPWAHGTADAPLVEGRAEDLILAVAGRKVGLAPLAGPGVKDLAAKLAA